MTFSEKHRWVFPISPTAFADAKLDGYFGKLRKSEIEVMQKQGDFGGHLELGEVAKSKKPKTNQQNGKFQIEWF